MRKQQNISHASPRRAVDGRLTGRGAHGAETRLGRLLHLAADFNATLDKCSVSAEVGAVHRLRSGSRRIQAIVETMLREGGARAKPLQQPARAWLRQLKRLRRAAGPVRDLDVHRKLLKKPLADWIKESARAEGEERVPAAEVAGPVAVPEAEPIRGQASRLADWLKKERQIRVEAFEKHLEKHCQKLEEPEIALLAAADRMRAPRGKAPRSAGVVALYDFARLAHAIPALDANNLHEFRKSVKKARYVAESGGDDPISQTVAKALKRIQDAIGAWHDWLCLTQEGQAVLGGDGAELMTWLAIETGRHFTQALAITARLRGELLGEWIAAQNQTRERQTGTGAARKLPSRTAVGSPAKKSQAS